MNTPPYLVYREDEKGSAPGALGDHGDEARVDGAEVVVVDTAGDGHAIVAVLLGGGLAEHVPELGAAVLGAPCHLDGGTGRGSGEDSTAETGKSPHIVTKNTDKSPSHQTAQEMTSSPGNPTLHLLLSCNHKF